MATSLGVAGALLAFLSFLTWTAHVDAMEIYLRELTVYTSHENSFFSNSPEVYLICDDDRDPVFLRTVVTVDKKYEFGAEQIPATHVNSGECVLCTLKEFDLLDDDDVYGKMKLCAADFVADGTSELKTENEFHAKFECPLCKAHHDEEQERKAVAENKAHESKERVNVHPAGVEVNRAVSMPVTEEKTAQKGVSKTGVVGIGICLFAVGLMVGAVSVRFFFNNHRDREMRRVREMSAYLAQGDIPYEKLPRENTSTTTSRTTGIGPTSYHAVPTDDTGDSTS